MDAENQTRVKSKIAKFVVKKKKICFFTCTRETRLEKPAKKNKLPACLFFIFFSGITKFTRNMSQNYTNHAFTHLRRNPQYLYSLLVVSFKRSHFLFQSWQSNVKDHSEIKIQKSLRIRIWRYSFADCRAIIGPTFAILDKELNRIALHLVWHNPEISEC